MGYIGIMFRDPIPITENQMAKKVETGLMQGFIGI